MIAIIIIFLTILGSIILGLLGLMLLYVLIGALIETVRDDVIEYNSHMFHGKPKAKCRCADCESYCDSTHLCKRHNWERCSEDFFCKDAAVRTYWKGVQNGTKI